MGRHDEHWYAIHGEIDGETLWLEDTCAGGKWSADMSRAKAWRTPAEAWAELEACDIDGSELELAEVVFT